MNRKVVSCLLVFPLLLNACTNSERGGVISDLSDKIAYLSGDRKIKSKNDLGKKAYRTRVGMQDDTRFQRLAFMEAAIVVASRHRANLAASAMYNPRSPEDQQRLALSLRQQAAEYAQQRIEVYQRFHSGVGDSPYKDSLSLLGSGVSMLPYGDTASFLVTFAGYMESKSWKDKNPANTTLNQYEAQRSYLTQRAMGIADSYLETYTLAKESSQTGVKKGELLFLEGWNIDLNLSMPDEEGSAESNLNATLAEVEKTKYSPNTEVDSKIKKTVKEVIAKVKDNDSAIQSEQGFFTSMEQSYSFEVNQELEFMQKNLIEGSGLTRAQQQQIFEANLNTLERTGSILSSMAILMGDSGTAQRISGFTNSISGIAKAMNEFRSLDAAIKAGEMTDKVASSAKLAASAGMANAVLGMAVFLYSLQDDSVAEQAKLWNEVFKQLNLILDNIQQMRAEIDEGFRRLERTQFKTMEMLDDLISIVRFNTEVLIGIKYQISEVRDQLVAQGIALDRISSKVDMTYQLVKMANERSIFINSIDNVNEKCLLNPSLISDSVVGECFDSVYSILRNAITAVDDKPVLATSSKGRYEQFTGFFEDSVRALPLALKMQAGPNISYVNQAYQLTISLVRMFSRSIVDEKFTSLRSVLKSQFEYLESFRTWLQKSFEFEKNLKIYEVSRNQLSNAATSLWRSTFQEVLEGNQVIDSMSNGSYDEPAVDVTTMPICPPVDSKGQIVTGAEDEDYNRDLRPLAVLDSKYWAHALPDDIKSAIFYKKGKLFACSYTVISNSTAKALSRYGQYSGYKYEAFGADEVECSQTYKSQVRFFWQDAQSKLREQILSVDIDNVAKYSFKSHIGPYRKSDTTSVPWWWQIAFWTVPQTQLIRENAAPLDTGRELIKQQYITDKHSRVCSQWKHRFPDGRNHNFRFMQERVFESKSRLNEGLRGYFVQEKRNIKPSFVAGYSDAPIGELVERTNKLFAEKYKINHGDFAQLEDMVYEVGYRKEVLKTILAFAYGKAFAANGKLRGIFDEGQFTQNALLGVNTFDMLMNEQSISKKAKVKSNDEDFIAYSEKTVTTENGKTKVDFHLKDGAPASAVLLSKGTCEIDIPTSDNSIDPFDLKRGFKDKITIYPDDMIGQVPRLMGEYCVAPTVQYFKFYVEDQKSNPLPSFDREEKAAVNFASRLTDLALSHSESIPSRLKERGADTSENLLKLVSAKKEKWAISENRNSTAEYMTEVLDFEFKQNQKFRKTK